MRDFLRPWLLLPSAVLAASSAYALEQVGDIDARDTTVAAPLSISPDQDWDGIDGTWSTFTLRVGTPSQYARTLLSFSSYQTWVVVPQGCAAAASASTCAQARGGVFTKNDSSTWDDIGLYDISILGNLGYTGNAIYGYDTVGLGGQGEGGPTLKNTTVGGLAVEDFYLGVFGINPMPTNFTTFNEPSPSYMTLLKEQKYIPSVSFGYTAGAKYRFTGVLASLTLGGYDASKFIDNGVEFMFAADNGRDVVVAIQDIVTPSRDASQVAGTSLLPAPIYAYIDATVPHLWLPIEACHAFETEFGLQYDNKTQLYIVNQTLHDSLTSRNPNVTFTLAQGLNGGSNAKITLPYSAFDLIAQPPYAGLSNNTYYFPLQRAQNDTQYTIGRAFLQEAYISVDYERSRFNVSQVSWVQNSNQNLIAIPPYTGAQVTGGNGASTGSSGSSASGISTGAIIGIAVAAAAIGITLVGALLWYFLWKRRATKEAAGEKPAAPPSSREGRGMQENVFPKAELEGSGVPDGRRLISAGGSVAPDTPHSMNPPSSSAGYFHGSGTTPTRSPTTPSGEGTHSSTRSDWPFSPLSASSETGSHERQVFSPERQLYIPERQVYEMPGDMPPVREADGRPLSEKEAMERRNMVYNGVDSTSSTSVVNEGAREPRRVDPREIARMSSSAMPPARNPARNENGRDATAPTRPLDAMQHRAFSFEFAESDRELYE